MAPLPYVANTTERAQWIQLPIRTGQHKAYREVYIEYSPETSAISLLNLVMANATSRTEHCTACTDNETGTSLGFSCTRARKRMNIEIEPSFASVSKQIAVWAFYRECAHANRAVLTTAHARRSPASHLECKVRVYILHPIAQKDVKPSPTPNNNGRKEHYLAFEIC